VAGEGCEVVTKLLLTHFKRSAQENDRVVHLQSFFPRAIKTLERQEADSE
jgi:hypothetical protein